MEDVSSRLLQILIVLGLLASLVSGCGAPAPVIRESYPLESVNREGNATSYVYRASNQTVAEVAEYLTAERTPDQISPASRERMFLIYGNQWYHLQQDAQIPADTLVEVDSAEYVRNNYDASFLQLYLTSRLIGGLFGTGYGAGTYRGYGSREVYKPSQGSYRVPTAQDKKIAPPITVVRQGAIARRGRTGTVTGGTGGNKSGSDYYDAPQQRIKKPQTRYRTGRIGRRGRR